MSCTRTISRVERQEEVVGIRKRDGYWDMGTGRWEIGDRNWEIGI